MLTKNQAKFISSLRLKKNREEHGLFIAEGIKTVNDLLNSGIRVRQIYSSSNFQLSLFNHHIEVIRVKQSELKRLSSFSTPNEVLALCEIPRYELDLASLKDKLSLVLDTVQDPGNLGTLVRVADWFGIENIICSEETVELYNPKVIQATMGSVSRVRVHYTDLGAFFARAETELPLLQVYGTLVNAESIYGQGLSAAGLILMGNESKGISEHLLPFVKRKIAIPNYGKGAESLNVAVAAAVICAEFRRTATAR
ncbi:MAG: RNA methyltransferase [Bacteroidota bacterium]